MVNYLELPIGEKMPEVINAVIEIPLEGINKYEYDKQLHVSGLTVICTRRCIIPATMGLFRQR